ncbi:hypothetical protein NDA16_003461 [Ustilago loliicola]|nr:hypothetical protein NDA16_003461 [Ustilago loliicola]
MSDRSTPSTHHSPLTPFTPVFDVMPGTATSAKTHFAVTTRPSISSERPQAHEMQGQAVTHAEMGSLASAAATLQERDTATNAEEGGRGGRNTEQWILTQRQRKALLQSEERLLDAEQTLTRLSIRADERNSAVHPTISLPRTEEEAASEARSRQDSRSTDATDDDQHARTRQTMVISTVSTPDESVDPFAFVAGKPSLMAGDSSLDVGAAMQRAASHNAVQTSTEAGSKPMTRNRSGTTGPWPQSPLLLNINLSGEAGVKATAESAVSPALTTIIHSNYATPQIDAQLPHEGSSFEAQEQQRESGVQGLGLEFGSPDLNAGSLARDSVKGFAPITTDLLRQASRCMTRVPQDSASPHLSIQMSPGDTNADKLNRSRSKSKEALLTRGSRQHLYSTDSHKQGLGFDLVSGPSPLLPNDCRSPRTASGKELGSSAPSGLSAIVQGSVVDVAVHRAQVSSNTNALLHSQSIASSISAFVYNATPAPSADADTGRYLHLPNKPKTGSIGWRRSARKSQALALGMRSDKHTAQDSADVRFVNINLDDGGLETEITLDPEVASAGKGGEGAKAGQWVSKLWSAMASPRRTSFGVGANAGDRSVDIELANSSGDQSGEKVEGPGPKGESSASRGSFRPLSLVEKRQSSGRYHLDAATRQRFRSPTPGEDDEVAEKDARAVALRLLAGSPRLPPPAEELAVETAEEQIDSRADLSAEEREKERIEALKKLRRMSAIERQRKRNSGIGYITSTTAAVESSRLAYVRDSTDGSEQHQDEAAARHGGLSRAGSVNNKRMSMTVFGGKQRSSTLPMPPSTDTTEAAVATAVGAERAWLDAMRSPRVADSPSGFTPRMMFEPQDWAANEQQQQQFGRQRQTSNHIPLMLSGSATAAHRQAPALVSANEHGLTVSELERARDEMRRLAGQGMAFKDEELAHDGEGETFHTPMPDAPDSWSYAQRRDHQHYYPEDNRLEEAEFDQAQHHTTALGDFGISPEKKEAHLHRRTRTARFAVDDDHHHLDDEADPPAVSIFTRSQQHRHRASGSFSLRYGSHDQHPAPLTSKRSRSKRRASTHHSDAGGHGLFATSAALLDGNTPSKNMFWAGFLGMPWLWMIGGWYLTPDGQLRHPSADDPRVRSKFDVWQHEPSMQHQGSATSSPNAGSSSTTFGGEQSWGQGESASGLGLSGMPSAMSYAASSIGTANSAKTTNSDPNRPPPTKTRKSKTRSLGSLLDTNPQISFYQSPVRVLQEPQPGFGGVWRGAGMDPVPEVEEPRRSRIFAGFPEYDDQFSPTPSSTAVAEPKRSLLTALLNPSLLATTASASTISATSTTTSDTGEITMLSTYNHLLFLRAIFRIIFRVIFRVIVLVRIARFRNSATPISALVLNELLR